MQSSAQKPAAVKRFEEVLLKEEINVNSLLDMPKERILRLCKDLGFKVPEDQNAICIYYLEEGSRALQVSQKEFSEAPRYIKTDKHL